MEDGFGPGGSGFGRVGSAGSLRRGQGIPSAGHSSRCVMLLCNGPSTLRAQLQLGKLWKNDSGKKTQCLTERCEGESVCETAESGEKEEKAAVLAWSREISLQPMEGV